MLNRITRSYYLPILIFALFLLLSGLAIYQSHSRTYVGKIQLDPSRIPQLRAQALLQAAEQAKS